MKYMTHVGTIIVFFLSLFIYTKFAGPIPFSLSSIVTTKTDTFTVTGEGKVTAVPDIATVSVGVTAQAPTAKAAQELLNTNINAVSSAVKQTGVDAKDIKTSNYSVNPQYDYRNPKRTITGYTADTDLTIKVRKMDNANAVIDAATGAGANQIGGISFDVDDKNKAENEARQLAVNDAKKKAQDASRIAGFSLGRVINYSENFNGIPRPMFAKLSAAGGAEAEDQTATQVEPGTNEITVNVSLSYEIR